MLFSIIIPVYNTPEEYLTKCIDSLTKNSTYINNTEIIIIDDGSNELVKNLCDDFAQSNTNIIVYHQSNQGSSVARNVGIIHASGDYILFVDGDDYVSFDLLDVLKEKICSELIQFDILLFKYSKNSFPKNCGSKSIKQLNSSNHFIECIISGIDTFDQFPIGTPWGKLFRRQFLIDNDIMFNINLRKSQDKIFMLECYARLFSIYCIDYFGYVYNQNENSMCNKYNPNAILFYDNLEEAFKNFMQKEAIDNRYFYTSKILFLYELCIIYFFHPDNKMSRKKRKSTFIEYFEKKEYNILFPLVDTSKLKFQVRIFYYILCCQNYSLLYSFFDSLRIIKKIRKIFF